MSELHEESNEIRKEEQLSTESEGIDNIYLSIKESSTKIQQETDSKPVSTGPPPMPERWNGTSFPKAYSLGFTGKSITLIALIVCRFGSRI